MAEDSGEESDLLFPANYLTVPLGDVNIITVYIEVCQKRESLLETYSIQTEIDKYLLDEEEFVLNKVLYNTVLPYDINYIRISSPEDIQKVNFLAQNIKKHYNIYQTWESDPEIEHVHQGGEDVPIAFNWCLPNSAFEGLWESLVLENGLKEQLMSYVQTTLLYANKQINAQMVLWNGIVLLYGPPGTGKTSLCKALAQKLSIRFSFKYKTNRLIEVSSHNLLSKWFSESSKLVFQMFSMITSWLQSKSNFVCILIDEVESLVQSRITSTGDPSDAVRVVNTVLTQLDQLQRYPNFLILATSNSARFIDSAFADRADLKLYIPYPSQWGIYDILKTSIEELISNDLVKGTKNDFFDGMIFKSMDLNNQDESNGTIYEILENSKILLNIAARCSDIGGRTLRKIPFLTSTKFINKGTPSIKEFLSAMINIVRSYDPERTNVFGL